MNSPGRSVPSMLLDGDQWKNNSRKNEETDPKQKQHLVVDVTGDGSKVGYCKNNIALELRMSGS